MRLISLLVLVFISCGFATSQEEIKLKPNKKFYRTDDFTISYPVFEEGIERIIGKNLDSLFRDFYNADESVSIREVLLKARDEGLVNLNYEIFRTESFLSIRFANEWIAAYPTYWQTLRTYSLTNGRELEIEDMIEEQNLKEFENFIRVSRVIQTKKYIDEMKTILNEKEMDTTDFKLLTDAVKDYCLPHKPKCFFINENAFYFEGDCAVPKILILYSPYEILAIPRNEMKPYLVKKYR